ncbi:MAG: phosphodiester glycosidase family protein [Selenomonadaceae bacterium]|nr:phosphodiester glycosidase family protein [Selenomonadaceae bacterium]
MIRILVLLLLILATVDYSAIVEAAETTIIVERGSKEESVTVVNDQPTWRDKPNKSNESGANDTSSDSEQDEVYLPSMDVPPMSTKSPSSDPESDNPPEPIEQPIIPDYSIPEVPADTSTPPSVDNPPEIEEVEGLEFRMVNRDGIMAFAIIADHEKYTLQPVLARDKIPGRATVKQMSNEYNAIAAINASYFALSGEILGNTKVNGVVAGTTYYTRSTMGINADGSTIFGRTGYYGNVTMGGASLNISGVDCERGADALVIYNLHQGATTGTNDFGVEYIVTDGIVTDIRQGKGNSEIPINGYVVSVHGKAAELFQNTQIGDRAIFDESIIDVDGVGDFDQAIQVIGAGPRLVKDGMIYVNVDEEEFPNDIRLGRAPRSAVGVTQYGDYIFAIVDGRQAHSKGCTLQEWAEILLNDFDAVNAINLDGGGSTELVVKGDIVNSPSDGKERPVGDALVMIKKAA